MPAVVSVSLIVGLWSRWILQPGRSPAGGCAISEHSSPWYLLGHHPPQFFTKVAVFSVQKLILNGLRDIRDVPGCNQFDAQSHVLQKAKGAAVGIEELPGPVNGPVRVARTQPASPCCYPSDCPSLLLPPQVLTSKRMRKASRAAKMCQNWTV